MLKDVIFNNGEKSAYHDWNIVLTKSEIPLPKAKTSTVDIVGADGVLDLSEVLTGEVKFQNRAIKLTFELMDDVNYEVVIAEISNYIHGKNLIFTITNEEEYFYSGRATINSWECSKRKGKIVITIDAEPYKYEVNETIISTTVNGTKRMNLVNTRKSICPVVIATGNINMTFNNAEFEITEGSWQFLEFVLSEGDNRIVLSGNGTVKFVYRRGLL